MEKPILFNTEMVKAILDGRKTMTRRVVKGLPDDQEGCDLGIIKLSDGSLTGYGFESMPYQPSDILWVRETWKYYEKAVGYAENFHVEKFLAYKADQDNNNIQKSSEWFEGKWHPSIHMPRSATRLFLRVKNVRVERLQDITEEDARDEGVKDPYDYQHPDYYEQSCFKGVEINKCAFAGFWNTTIKKYDYGSFWESNPWVWVIEFERVKGA